MKNKPKNTIPVLIGKKTVNMTQAHFKRFSMAMTEGINSGKDLSSVEIRERLAEETRQSVRKGGFREPRKKAFMALLENRTFNVERDVYKINGSNLIKNGKQRFKISLGFREVEE